MDIQEIYKGNILIAKFMAKSESDLAVLEHDLKKAGTVESISYHKYWDWLMPVVEKIGQTEDNMYTDPMSEVSLYSSIISVFRAVVEFIEWFNNQNNTTPENPVMSDATLEDIERSSADHVDTIHSSLYSLQEKGVIGVPYKLQIEVESEVQTKPLLWIERLLPLMNEYMEGDCMEEPMDGDDVDDFIKIIKAKINFHQGNITELEYNKILG